MTATTDVQAGFTDVDYAVLVGAMPRREGMERKDLLKANVKIFKEQGNAINQFAKKTVKVKLQDVFLYCITIFFFLFIKINIFVVGCVNLLVYNIKFS